MFMLLGNCLKSSRVSAVLKSHGIDYEKTSRRDIRHAFFEANFRYFSANGISLLFFTANTHNPSDDSKCFKNISKVKQLEIFMKRREIYLYFLKGRSYMCK